MILMVAKVVSVCLLKKDSGRNQYGKLRMRPRFEQATSSSNFNVRFPVAFQKVCRLESQLF